MHVGILGHQRAESVNAVTHGLGRVDVKDKLRVTLNNASDYRAN